MIEERAGASARPLVWFGLAIALAWLLFDQASKAWMVGTVMQPPRVIPLTPWFNLVLAWNRGVSFSMLNGGGAVMPYALTALALAVVAVLWFWLLRLDRRLPALAVGMIIGGALGNVVDRLRFGAVIDFLDFHALGYHFPAFNVADSGISVGVALLVLDGLLRGGERR